MPTAPPLASRTVRAGDAELFVRDETHAAPWETPKAVLLLHAEAEHSGAWFGWMPRLAGRFRVVRPDQRGFGRSGGDAAAGPDRLVADAVAVLDAVGSDAAHVVAARHAVPIALRLAAAHPARVTSLVLCGGAADPAAALGERRAAWVASLRERGMAGWAEAELPTRLGNDAEPEALAGWAALLGATDAAAFGAWLGVLDGLDATDALAGVACPTLVIATDGSATTPVEATIAWSRRIGASELLVLTGTGDHVAASHAGDAAPAALSFWRKHAKAAPRERPAADDRERRRAERQAARTAAPT